MAAPFHAVIRARRGYVSDALHFPDHGLSLAVQINCDHPEMAETRRVLAAIGELLVAKAR